jgi:CRISPR-associated endonuclease/helicase Cas3
LEWDHIDAGVAHLAAHKARMAAWLVRAHHAPGLPAQGALMFGKFPPLRGRRRGGEEASEAQVARTDAQLPALRALHRSVVGDGAPQAIRELHGLSMRLALSCLVDADHADTAESDGAPPPPQAPAPRWEERLEALDRHVAALARNGGARTDLRQQFYAACRAREPDAAMIACEGPVGIGKTTAVLAYLLRRAIETGARRLFVVAPFTAILSQTANVLREALVLADEKDRPFDIVAEHHHRADFADIASRDLATLWTAPIVLTTAVQFLETLSSNVPAALRKLHMLPGSVVFFDEAHALAPVTAQRRTSSQPKGVLTRFLPQYWRWFCDLADRWTCSFVFASGSLARVWQVEDIVEQHRRDLLDLVPANLVRPLIEAEAARVRYVTHPRFSDPNALLQVVFAQPGPRLLIMNTVQSAAVVAQGARAVGKNVLHLSNALCPRDRDAVLQDVKRRLARREDDDWILVATSLVEAGVDISFATAFRERFGLTSLLQIAGRVNRHGEFGACGGVHDFMIESVAGLTRHPDARVPGDILSALFEDGRLDGQFEAAQLVTEALRREVAQSGQVPDLIGTAEKQRHYPDVADLARVIQADTKLVVVDPCLAERLIHRDRVTMRELLAGSVQIWATKIASLALDPICQRPGVYRWPHDYDPDFLGYMAGALKIADIARGDAAIW